MIPELGNFSLTLSLAFALCLSIFPLVGVYMKNERLIAYAWPLSYAMFAFLALSIAILGYSFVHDDFSVAYVAQHSNTQLPYYFKISAIWGGHEGSLLLWVFILSSWTALVALLSKHIEKAFVATVLSVMGMISTGFAAFTLLTSNPFSRFLPNFPLEGRDLNPLLQDVGLIVHPPMLYMGYVGFSVAFAFAIAALISGKIDTAWARWSRPWTVAAWGFLTVGIVLGSWWAYYELGWGGWWFWDPVENASFMPWLVGTALIHSLAVTEKRGTFKNWTVLLAIFAFSLSLLGTFLVRSGVITSVHSFASDPDRGLFILLLLAIAAGGSLTLFAFRAVQIYQPVRFEWLSREMGILTGNVLLIVTTLSVLLGTLAPLIISSLDMGRISVGPPYFNFVFNILFAGLIVLMGIGPFIRWKKAQKGELKRLVPVPLSISMIAALITPLFIGEELNLLVSLGLGLAFWIITTTLFSTYQQHIIEKQPLTRSYIGMVLAHVGMALSIIGVTVVSNYDEQLDVKMDYGEVVSLSGYDFKFVTIEQTSGPNYTADRGVIELYSDGDLVTTLHPERRSYTVQTMGMTEAGIDPGLMRDIYVALGDPLAGTAWAIRLHYKPCVRFIWLGGLFMAFGGGLAMLDRRYRRKKQKAVTRHTIDQSMLGMAGSK